MRHNYVIEYDEEVSIDRIQRDRKNIRNALRRGMILAAEPGIRIRDLGPRLPRIRMVDVERHHAR